MGFETAFHEITLVFFTTLAPSGVVAYVIVSLFTLAKSSCGADFLELNKRLALPFVVVLVGLVASATHLGNPSNALYVFLGAFHSPLSKEIISAVLFLAVAEFGWLYSFVLNPNIAFQKALLIMQIVLGIGFLLSMAFAYSASTIVTWAMWVVPFNLIVNALVCGPVVALLTISCVGDELVSKRVFAILIVMSFIAAVVNVAGYCMQYYNLGFMSNATVSAISLVPNYYIMLMAFIACSIGSDLVLVKAFFSYRNYLRWVLGVSSLLIFIGIFCMRFVFYQMHMTVGLGV